jgi:3-hydroxyanthranilate 3,4-dioxygenase
MAFAQANVLKHRNTSKPTDMSIQRPFNLSQWIEENRHLLKPPVGNWQVYRETTDFIVMVVGGPNSRKDFHYNETEELFYQLEGDVVVRIVEDGKIVDIPIREGEMFLLPPKVPHSPLRGPNTVGLVVERVRREGDMDGFLWFCENCHEKLYEEYFVLTDIVAQFPPIMERFYSDREKCTCKKCGAVMERPQPAK